MIGSVFDNILRERELKNEKKVAIARFLFITVFTILDFLSYFKIVSYYSISPTILTIILDISFILFSIAVLTILLINKNFKYLKYFTISLDYLIITMMLIFDPTVPKEGQLIYWTALVAYLFLYFLNLLRYSKAGTIYAGILSISAFLATVRYNTGNIAEAFLIPMVFGLLVFLYIGYSITTSNKKMMVEANTKKMMERYLPPQLVGELYKKNISLEPGGINREVTILFSDIRSFTSISEAMPAKDVVALLNNYLSTMTDIIYKNNGTIDKFIGDAIMTIFGAPIKSDDDVLRAIRTAILMNKALKELNKIYAHIKKPLEIGIGIHTGDVIVGNIGSDKRLDYTVIGDNVNLSSRIEGMTKYYKCPILISQSTFDKLNDESMKNSFLIREVDNVIVKGKSNNIRIYEIMCYDNDVEKRTRKWIKEEFEKGLHFYQKRNFVEAIVQFSKLQNDGLSKLYTKRCEQHISIPPDESWNGTFTMETK